MVRRTALVIALLALAGCPDEPPDRFHCHIDEQCVEDGVQGFCEMSNDCSFEDEQCDSQRRYARLSKEEGACVATMVSTSLATNGGFESGVTGWIGESGDADPSRDAHTLDGAATVCHSQPPDGEPLDITFALADNQDLILDAQDGESYVARAWVKAVDSPSDLLLQIELLETLPGGDDGGASKTDPPIALSAEWQQVTVEHAVTTPLERIHVLVEATEPDEEAFGCFLVDDIAVFRLP